MPLDELRPLLTTAGPCATAYLIADSSEPDAATTLALRWKNRRRELEDAGAPAATLEAMDAAVGVDTEAVERGIRPADDNVARSSPVDDQAEHAGGEVRCVIGRDAGVVFDEYIGRVVADDRSAWSELPSVVPLVDALQQRRPHLVVILDRTGADVRGVAGDGSVLFADEVEGTDFQITKVQQGGFSHQRHHRRARNRRAANARLVAERVTALARDEAFDAVFVAGDVEAVGAFLDGIPGDVSHLVVALEHGARGPESGFEGVADDVERELAHAVAERTASTLARHRAGVAQGDGGVNGVKDTVAQLQLANVDTLLVTSADLGELWFGDDGPQLAAAERELASMGVRSIHRAPGEDVMVRAAVLTGADVCVAPASEVDGGVGAVLRAPLVAA